MWSWQKIVKTHIKSINIGFTIFYTNNYEIVIILLGRPKSWWGRFRLSKYTRSHVQVFFMSREDKKFIKIVGCVYNLYHVFNIWAKYINQNYNLVDKYYYIWWIFFDNKFMIFVVLYLYKKSDCKIKFDTIVFINYIYFHRICFWYLFSYQILKKIIKKLLQN